MSVPFSSLYSCYGLFKNGERQNRLRKKLKNWKEEWPLEDSAVSREDYLLEMCSGRAAWTVVPEKIDKIDLEIVTARIEAEGWDCTLRNRLCCTFSGELADITLYPSGKLLVKSGERDVAAAIAERHMQVWLAEF